MYIFIIYIAISYFVMSTVIFPMTNKTATELFILFNNKYIK